MTQSVRPFDVSKILDELFYEAEKPLYNLARGEYNFRLIRDRESGTNYYLNTEPSSLVEAADALNKVLFKYYYLTEQRFLRLLVSGMKVIRTARTKAGAEYLESIGYPKDGELYKMTDLHVIKEFMSDFQENFKFRKTATSAEAYAFSDLLHYTEELLDECSNNYDADKAEMFRASASLGLILRVVGGIAKHTTAHSLNKNFVNVFEHWRLTSAVNLPWNKIVRKYTIDFCEPDTFEQKDFHLVLTDFQTEVRQMLMLSGMKRGLFPQFIRELENSHLNHNELVRIDRFSGESLLKMAREFLRTRPMCLPVSAYFYDNDVSELRKSVEDTRVSGANIRLLYDQIRLIYDSWNAPEEEEGQPRYKPTPGEGGAAAYQFGLKAGEASGYAVKLALSGEAQPGAAPAKNSQSSGFMIPVLALAAGAAMYYS